MPLTFAETPLYYKDSQGQYHRVLSGADMTDYRTSAAQDAIDANLMALGLTGAVVGDLVRVNSVDANGKPTGWRKAPLCEIKTNPNLLDNWYFVGGGSQQGGGQFPINQRELTYYINPGYSVDRWKIDTTTGATMSVNATFLYVRNGTVFHQPLEDSVKDFLNRKTITISVLIYANDTFYLHTGTAIYNKNPETNIPVINIPNDNDAVSYIGRDGNVYFENASQYAKAYVSVKLELGSEQTLAHQENPIWVLNEIPDYGEELAECQRYYYKAQRCLFLRSGSTNSWAILAGFKVKMRNPPSLQLINSYGLIPGVSDQAVPTILSSSTPYVSEDGFGDVDMTVTPDGALFYTDAAFSADL